MLSLLFLTPKSVNAFRPPQCDPGHQWCFLSGNTDGYFLGCARDGDHCEQMKRDAFKEDPNDPFTPSLDHECPLDRNDPLTGLNQYCNYRGSCIGGDSWSECVCCALDELTLEDSTFDGIVDCPNYSGGRFEGRFAGGACQTQTEYPSAVASYYMEPDGQGNDPFVCNGNRAEYPDGTFFDEVAQKYYESKGYFGKISPFACTECTQSDPCEFDHPTSHNREYKREGYTVVVGSDLSTYYNMACAHERNPFPRVINCPENYDGGYKARLSFKRATLYTLTTDGEWTDECRNDPDCTLEPLNIMAREMTGVSEQSITRVSSLATVGYTEFSKNSALPEPMVKDPCGFFTKNGVEKACTREGCCSKRGGCYWSGAKCLSGGSAGVPHNLLMDESWEPIWIFEKKDNEVCKGKMLKTEGPDRKVLRFKNLDWAKAACVRNESCSGVVAKRCNAENPTLMLCDGTTAAVFKPAEGSCVHAKVEA